MSKILIDPKELSNITVNPMVVGIKNSQCKINKFCALIASGFGTEIERCEHLMDDEENNYCTIIIQDDKSKEE